jgi:hypothetical protein
VAALRARCPLGVFVGRGVPPLQREDDPAPLRGAAQVAADRPGTRGRVRDRRPVEDRWLGRGNRPSLLLGGWFLLLGAGGWGRPGRRLGTVVNPQGVFADVFEGGDLGLRPRRDGGSSGPSDARNMASGTRAASDRASAPPSPSRTRAASADRTRNRQVNLIQPNRRTHPPSPTLQQNGPHSHRSPPTRQGHELHGPVGAGFKPARVPYTLRALRLK